MLRALNNTLYDTQQHVVRTEQHVARTKQHVARTRQRLAQVVQRFVGQDKSLFIRTPRRFRWVQDEYRIAQNIAVSLITIPTSGTNFPTAFKTLHY